MTTSCTSTTCTRWTGWTWCRALKADPKATSSWSSRSRSWPLSSPGYFRDVQNRLKKFVESGQLGPFKNGYWGNPAYLLPPEANLMAVTHYLEALDLQKEIVKIHTIFGGKNPHPNWLVGGVPCAINVRWRRCGRRHQHGAAEPRLVDHRRRASTSSSNVYIPDVLAIGALLQGLAVSAAGCRPER